MKRVKFVYASANKEACTGEKQQCSFLRVQEDRARGWETMNSAPDKGMSLSDAVTMTILFVPAMNCPDEEREIWVAF